MELSGTAVTINTSSLVLALEEDRGSHLAVGEQVRLELSLPVNTETAGARYLAVRARVMEVIEIGQGLRRFTMTFRKPSFKKRVSEGGRKPPRVEGNGWAM